MADHAPIGFHKALALTLAHIRPLAATSAALTDAVNRIASRDLYARVDSPSVDASLKDGYAVDSRSVAAACADHPVRLRLTGFAAAGGGSAPRVTPETTIRVLTGAALPAGADAVVAEEFTQLDGSCVVVVNFAEPGRNVMARGGDVAAGDPIVRAGELLTPGRLGLLAAAGHSRVDVIGRPTVALVATGDEVVAPGLALPPGKLYASNMVTLGAWCRRYGMAAHSAIVPDDAEALSKTLQTLAPLSDAIITSGGAWTGDRDLVADVLRQLGWRQIFHRVRMGPGKAVGFGLLSGKPVFILPGGPSSNLTGFLKIALPGLLTQVGCVPAELPAMGVRTAEDLAGRNCDWTHFIFGKVVLESDMPIFRPLRRRSRLHDMAEADAIVTIPEGGGQIAAGTLLWAQLLHQPRWPGSFGKINESGKKPR